MSGRILRITFVAILATIAAALGTVTALVTMRPGKDLLARLVTEESNRLVRGTVSIGRINGNFLNHLTLDTVVVRDTTGALLADIPRLEINYRLADLLANRLVFRRVRVTSPRLQVIKHRAGRMNYQEILKLGESPDEPPGPGQSAAGKPGPLLELDDLVIENGHVEIRAPWNPDGRLKTAAARDSALAAERAKPGKLIEPGVQPGDSLLQVRVIEGLWGRFPQMRITSPDHKPFTTSIDSLAARLSDPAVTVVDLKGRITQGGDSLLFDLTRAALPATVAKGAGRIDWPKDTVLYHFELAASRVSLVDLRWISPEFPALAGRGRVKAVSIHGSRSEFTLRGLDLSDPTSRVTGDMVAITDVRRGLGFRDLALELTNFDLDQVRPYLDTLPFRGQLTGPLKATGFFDSMAVAADWSFHDTGVPGGADNRVGFDGGLSLGGKGGLTFHGTRVTQSDFDMRTVRLLTPAVRLDGRLRLVGTLDGPLHDVVYDGRVEHKDGDRPMSVFTGRTELDSRGRVLGLDAELTIDTLSFAGLRGTFPETPMMGSLHGQLELQGFLDSLEIDGDLTGEIGHYRATGTTTLQPPRWGAQDLKIDFDKADLEALSGRGPATRLAGHLELTGRVDSLVAPEVTTTLSLTAGTVREFAFDSARAKVVVHDSVITVDTATIRWEGGGGFAKGAIGWDAPHPGKLAVTGYALSLAPFDSVAAVALNLHRTEVTEEELMSGRAHGSVTIEGSLEQWRAIGRAQIDSLSWVGARVRLGSVTADLAGGRLGTPALQVKATADSIDWNTLSFSNLSGQATGKPTDFQWTFEGAGGSAVQAAATGAWRVDSASSARLLVVDSLAIGVLGRPWRLERPTTFRIDTVTVTDSVVLATRDGSGLIRMNGTLPGKGTGQFEIDALGIALRDLYALAQRDTAGIGGTVGLDVRLGGTLALPTFRGSATVTGPVIGDVKAPMVRGVFNYQNEALETNLTFWRTGKPILDIDALLPLDLSVAGQVTKRQRPGPLRIKARADSVDLGVMEALSSNFRGVVGTLSVDAQVEGTWDAPRLGGFLQVSDAAMFIPGLGVAYGPIQGRIRFTGDSIVTDSVVARNGDGVIRVSGGVRLEGLTRPQLGLKLSAQNFTVIDVPDFLTLRATGDVALTGPVARPVLTGDARATSSVLYFADLISKDIVNLEDPANADLVDTTALRSQNLRSQFQSRFLDSLTIRDLRFRVSEDVWLRSGEANVQLEGQVTVNKERRRAGRNEYRVSGQFNTPRGTYTLKLLPVTRTFTVEQGTVRYFNTPDLNAGLDISARYVVRTVTGGGTDDFPIIAHITGTLLAPKLSLATDAGRPPIPERDLLSLLVFGSTTNNVISGGVAGFATNRDQIVASLAATALSSELERSLISSPNAPFDLIEIRPGFAQGNSMFATGGTVTTLSFGRQLSNRLFAKLNLGGCIQRLDFNGQYLGATLEYRLNPLLKWQIAAEPVQSCLGQIGGGLVTPSRYQFGTDLKWDREY